MGAEGQLPTSVPAPTWGEAAASSRYLWEQGPSCPPSWVRCVRFSGTHARLAATGTGVRMVAAIELRLKLTATYPLSFPLEVTRNQKTAVLQ